MAVETKTHDQLVALQATQMQARTDTLIDFSIGAILRAIIEANSALGMWLQGLALKVLAMTRASTSRGSDLDSWVGDFGLVRLGAQSAAGTVTFARFTASAQALIPVGTIVESDDGTQRFTVVAATSNGAFNSGLNGYVIPANVESVDVPVAAVDGGSASNVGAATVVRIIGGISYVDTVTNAAAFSGGAAAETDEALRVRFVLFIAQLAKATKAAIAFAVATYRPDIQYTITEHYDTAGVWKPGYFYVTVDDGTTAGPSDALVEGVNAAIEAVRAAGVQFGVVKRTLLEVDITATITVAAGYDANVVKAAVGIALRTWVTSIGLGNPLRYTAVAKIIYEASGGVINATAITVNGGTSDIVATPRQRVLPDTITVN